ncbi:hypothetical protein BIWAKO_02225 [Bosea sp. BIWAKO-01]|nr:hypothetical protein BIWAKO_02225 [Bosea sp. BIWAKO-01]
MSAFAATPAKIIASGPKAKANEERRRHEIATTALNSWI